MLENFLQYKYVQQLFLGSNYADWSLIFVRAWKAFEIRCTCLSLDHFFCEKYSPPPTFKMFVLPNVCQTKHEFKWGFWSFFSIFTKQKQINSILLSCPGGQDLWELCSQRAQRLLGRTPFLGKHDDFHDRDVSKNLFRENDVFQNFWKISAMFPWQRCNLASCFGLTFKTTQRFLFPLPLQFCQQRCFHNRYFA